MSLVDFFHKLFSPNCVASSDVQDTKLGTGADLGISRGGDGRIFKKIENFVDLFLGRPN